MGMEMKFIFDKYILLTIFLLHVLAFSLSADAVRLSGGQVMDGKILDESATSIVIKTPQGIFTIDKKDIIEREDAKTGKVIARPPSKKMDLKTILWKSFIPAYSPLYETPGHPEYGLPFAMLNLGYFYKFVNYLATRQQVDFWQSHKISDPGHAFTVFIWGHSQYNTYLLNSGFTGDYSAATNVYYTFMKEWYNGHRDYRVGSEIMTEERYLERRKKYLTGYIVSSLVNAAVSWYVLKPGKTGGPGLAVYFIPTEDNGGAFGFVSAF